MQQRSSRSPSRALLGISHRAKSYCRAWAGERERASCPVPCAFEPPKNMYFFLNGRLVPDEDARVPVSDRGFLYGDAAFDTLCAYGGRLFRAQAHLQRLMHSLAALRIEPPGTLAQMEANLYR